jgi:TDG/mug DNA glycosylase family protein
MAAPPYRPDRKALSAATGKTIRDVIGQDLLVLFCGINPGLYSAAIGHHFGRPGNRFWPALHQAGFTDRQLSPFEDRELLKYQLGVTNLVARPTRSADELTNAEFQAGARKLVKKIERSSPQCVAILGVGAYRAAFAQPRARLGRQALKLGNALVWVLPNPSGLNAHYQLADFVRELRKLKALRELQPPPFPRSPVDPFHREHDWSASQS